MLFVDGDNWRAHEMQTFKYEDGAWQMVEMLEINTWNILTAVEGLFIRVSEFADVQWTWTSVYSVIVGQLFPTMMNDDGPDVFTTMCRVATNQCH